MIVGLREFREPVEVFLAAVGEKEPLAARIESGEQMYLWEREALACYLRGQLVPPRRGKGQKMIPYLNDTENYCRKRDLENAVNLYHRVVHQIRHEQGTIYGKRDEVVKNVADQFGLDFETLNNHLRRSQNLKSDSDESANTIIEFFHRWLRRTGRLPEYGPRTTLGMWQYLKSKSGPRRR